MILVYFDDADFQEAWKEWWEVRRLKKASKSERAVNRAINKLYQLAGNNKETAIKILDRSSDGGWTDLYPLKEEIKVSFIMNR